MIQTALLEEPFSPIVVLLINMNTDNRKIECPSDDMLSAWYDQELADNQVVLHLESCPQCQERIDSFQAIDIAIEEGRNQEQERYNRIISSCMARCQPIKKEVRPLITWLKVAAVVPIILCGVFISVYMYNRGATYGLAPEHIVNKPQENSESIADNSSSISFISSNKTLPPYPPVSPPSHPKPKTIQAIKIEKTVEHIWVCDNLLQSLKDLFNLYGKSIQSPENSIENDSKTRYTVRLELTDKELQNLVDCFHQQGYQLISPSFPQPNEGDVILFSGKQVHYTVILLKP